MIRLILKNAADHIRLKNRKTEGLPEPEKIPVLIPPKAMEAIKAEGSYEFVEAVNFPTEGAGGIYTGDYFKSLEDYLKQYPIPGSKDGHESQGDDFYTIGCEIQNKSGDEGVCYFRIMVPPEGWNSSNANLIRSLKAGIPELSIVANVEPTRGNDGKVYFTKEIGRPRNDIVPEGAMDISIGNSVDEKAVMALIEQGAIDMDSESTELVKNGKVFRRYAVTLQSAGDKAFAGRVLNAIAQKIKSQRRKNMGKFFNADGEEISLTYEDVIQWLKNAITNQAVTVEKLVSDLGMENKLRNLDEEAKTDEQLKEAEKLVDAIEEVLGLPDDTSIKDVIAATETALEELEKAEDAGIENAASELVGGRTLKNAKGEDEDNPQFLYAIGQLKTEKATLKQKNKKLRGQELNSAIEKLKTDPVMVSLRSKAADSMVNAQNGSGNKPDSSNIMEV